MRTFHFRYGHASRLGQTSIFWLLLNGALRASKYARDRQEVLGGVKAILVVEDDDDWRELTADLLTSEGYAVTQAHNGKDALAQLATMGGDPCLVLLDMMMPEMSGDQFLAVLDRGHRLASLPVVVMSANDSAAAVPGPRRFCRKPIDPDLLLAIVREFCGEPSSAGT